ncbi:MAG TPA: hypothetical protein VGW38_24615 [Chloroflexota bacterium]|nr:hypothetical protein [Chloroflexota bacterium]
MELMASKKARCRRQRAAGVFGTGIVAGVAALGSIAFACVPIVGTMTVEVLTGAHAGSKSVTVGQGHGANMAYCEAFPIIGGATGAKFDPVVITVGPAECPENPIFGSAAVNHLGTNTGANINFKAEVFGPDFSYTFTGGSNGCMTGVVPEVVTSNITMSIVGGVGVVTLPIPVDVQVSDTGGVCVDSTDAVTGLRAMSQAPLAVI